MFYAIVTYPNGHKKIGSDWDIQGAINDVAIEIRKDII